MRQTLRVVGVATFIVLKARAFEDRKEEKDAYDLVYCLEHAGPDAAAAAFGSLRAQQEDPYLFTEAEATLRRHFASDAAGEGYTRSGSRAYARFYGDTGDTATRRQREASGVVEAFLAALPSHPPPPLSSE